MSKVKKYYSLRSYISYLGRYKLRVGLVFGSFIIANSFLAVIPLFIGKLVGTLATQPVDSHQAYVYVAVLIGCSTGHDVMWRFCEFLYLKLLNHLSFSYENIVFKQITRKPYPYFVDKFTGKISSYINTLSQEFRTFMENVFWNYPNYLVSLVAVSIILTVVNWQTGAIFIGGLAMMVLVGKYTIINSGKYEKKWSDVQSDKNGKIIDSIANFVNVKSFQKEGLETTSIEREQVKTIRAANTSFVWNIVFWGSMSFFVRNVMWPASIALNVYLYLHGQLSLAELTTFLAAVLLFTSYVWEIIWALSQFNLKLARIEEAHTYLFGNVNIVKEYINDQQRALQPKQFNHVLALNDLHFAYPDKAQVEVLSGLEIAINKGERIGIVGKSGSGKTTLTKLLLGYYQVPDDQIVLDGKTIDTRDLSQLISYVPQDTSLFHRSIADNIAYATDKKVSQADIVMAAKQAHAHEFITKISEGYDALVGERGVKLSAGQRQRIAIARAFLDDRPILVLDEATSALDSESEVLVQKALELLWHDKTVIAIAHRLSTLRHMDRIVVIDGGQIIEQGSHKQLLAKKGKYAELWAHQSGGFLED